MAHFPKLLALLLAIPLLLPAIASAQQVLRFSDHEPLGGMRTRFLKDVLFPAIERESGGRLKVQDHWDGSVASAYKALGAVSEGSVTDMATVVPEYTAKELPLHQLFKSFPTGPSGDQQVAFFRRTYAEVPELRAELEQNNLVPVFLGTGYPVAFFSTRPLAGLQDLQGHNWRSASFWHQDFLRNAGATPVTMPWGEGVFNAMRDRTLDGLMVNVDSAQLLRVHEVARHALLSRELWLGHLYLLAMNRTAWDRLDPQDQAAIRRAAEWAYPQLGRVMDEHLARLAGELRSAGVNLRELAPQEVDAWRTTTRYREVQADWVNDQASKGLTMAAQVLRQITDRVAAAETTHEDTRPTPYPK